MNESNLMINHPAPDARRTLFKVAMIMLLSLMTLAVMMGMTQPSGAEAQPVNLMDSAALAPVIYPAEVISYHTFLPLVTIAEHASTFGVQFYGSLSPSTGFTRAVELGVGWVRVPIYWSQIEPINTTPDHYNWAGLDASVQAALDARIHVILTLDSNPTWAAAKPIGPVSDTANLQEFVAAAVARYPSVLDWEIYNEPDHIQRFGGKGDIYASTLISLYPVIKTANPAAQVLMGGVALDWFVDQGGPFDRNFLPTVLAHCSGTCFDIANFHYYPAFRSTWENYGPDIIGKTNYVRQLLATYQYTRPVMATETGWPSALVWGSPELAARYVPKSYSRSLAANLSATVWFAMLDVDSSNPGLLDSSTTPGTLVPRPAYRAYQTLTALMTGAVYQGPAYTIDPIEGYKFTVSGKRIDIYWYDCPLMRSPLPDGPRDCTTTGIQQITASRVEVIDKFGTTVIRNDGDDGVVDGKVTLTVGSSPIYIDYNP